MAEAAGQASKLNVFFSYSRDDLDFADQLYAALGAFDFELSIDRHSIPGGDEWEKRLGALIRDAGTVVFVLSPSSAVSKFCQWEVEEAVRLGKRILPVLCRELKDANPPPQLSIRNYIYLYAEKTLPGTGFGAGLADLVKALNTDLDWLREHTRYLRLAKEWDEIGRPPDRRLLSAPDIALAKAWAANRPPKALELIPLQLDFIKASGAEDLRQKSAETQRQREIAEAQAAREEALEREAEAQKSEAEARKREAEQARSLARRTLMGLTAAVVLALAAGGFAIFALQQRGTALRATETAQIERNKAVKATEDTQRQLDRANQALAQSIDNDLGLSENKRWEFSPRQREALWKLAVADMPVKREFVSILVKNPEELIRVSPGFAQISRALGLRRPNAN